MAAAASNADARRLATLFARMIQWAGVVAGRDVEAVLALEETAPDAAVGLVTARGEGIAARATKWRREAPVGTENESTPVFAPSDGANECLDCDLWLVVGGHPDVALPPVRPYALFVSDCAYRYHPELLGDEVWDRLERSGCPLLRNADVVLVNSPRTAADVRSFAGVPARRILEVPVVLPAEERPHGARPCVEEYVLWLPGATACERTTDTLHELRQYYEHLGGQLRTVIAAYERRQDAILRAALKAHPSLREHVLLAGELSPADRLAAIEQARVLLLARESAWLGLAPLDAAWLGVPILAARDAVTAHLDRALGLGVTFFERDVAGDLAGVLAELVKAGAPALPSRDALGSFQWSVQAPAFVDTLLHRLADRIPHAYR